MQVPPFAKPLLVAVFGLSLSAVWLMSSLERAGARPPLKRPLQVVAAAAPDPDPAMDAGVAQSSTTATIVFMTVPYVTSVVTWGKKPLGKILPGKPLVVTRPRDSGPLDVMIRSSGYLSVQTRAHTFSDSRVVVKLTPISKKNELLGYRVPLDAGPDGAIEGGVFPFEGGAPYDAGLPIMPPAPIPLPPPAQPPSMY
jgi:hypothetical protein